MLFVCLFQANETNILEIDNDDILALSNQPITFWGAVRQVLLTQIENQLK